MDKAPPAAEKRPLPWHHYILQAMLLMFWLAAEYQAHTWKQLSHEDTAGWTQCVDRLSMCLRACEGMSR